MADEIIKLTIKNNRIIVKSVTDRITVRVPQGEAVTLRSARLAQEYAQNAAQSAQSASQSKDDSAQSALIASEAKADAEAAQQASEQARNESVLAKEESEQARDDSQEHRQAAEQAEIASKQSADDAEQSKEDAEQAAADSLSRAQAAQVARQGAEDAQGAAEQAQQASEDARDISIAKADESAQSAASAEQSKQNVQTMETNVTNLHGEVETNTLTVSNLASQVANDRSQVASDKQTVSDDKDTVQSLRDEAQAFRDTTEQLESSASAARDGAEAARDRAITEADNSEQSADSAAQSLQQVQTLESNVSAMHDTVEDNTSTVATLAQQVSGDASDVRSNAAAVSEDRDAVQGLKTETQIYRNQSEQFKNDAEAAAAAASGGLLPVGGWDASTGNFPPAPGDNTQPWYRITVAGSLPGIGQVNVGDNIYWSRSFSDWFHIDNTERFTSINGYTGGAVELDTGDIPENGPQFHTQARVRGTTLTGLSETSSSKPSATDTVISALGKIVSKLWSLAVGDISGLQSALDSKLNSNHSSVTNSREWSASTVSQSEAEAGTSSTRRAWTAQRVRQAIVAWWNSVTSSWGRSFVATTDAQAGRSALGLGSMATRDTGTGGSQHRTNSQNEAKFVTLDTDQLITGEKTFSSQFRLNSAKRDVIFRQDSNALFLMQTADEDAGGTWTSYRPFTYYLDTGEIRFNFNDGSVLGVRIGSPSGGAKEAGSINAGRIYSNGTEVFEDASGVYTAGPGALSNAVSNMLSSNTNDQIRSSIGAHNANNLTTGTVSYARLPISSTQVSNWDTAFGWGNHAAVDYARLGQTQTFTARKLFDLDHGLQMRIGGGAGNYTDFDMVSRGNGRDLTWYFNTGEESAPVLRQLEWRTHREGEGHNNAFTFGLDPNTTTGATARGNLTMAGNISAANLNISNWNIAYSQRGSQIAGTGLSWSDNKLNVSNPFNPSGNYANLRARGTTAADIGVRTNSQNDSRYLLGSDNGVFKQLPGLEAENLDNRINAGNGVAAMATQANATIGNNFPWAGNGGTLLNFAQGSYGTQIYNTRSGGGIAWRVKRNRNGEMSDWKVFWDSSNLRFEWNSSTRTLNIVTS